MKTVSYYLAIVLSCTLSIAVAEECNGDATQLERCALKLLKSFGKGTSESEAASRIADGALVALLGENGIAKMLRTKSWKKQEPKPAQDCCAEGRREYDGVLSLAAIINSCEITTALLESFDYRTEGNEAGPFSEVQQLPNWETSQPELNCPAARILINNRNANEVNSAIKYFVLKGKYNEMGPTEKIILARVFLRINAKSSREARGLTELKEMRRVLRSQLKGSADRETFERLTGFIKLVEETAYPELDKLKRDEEDRRQQKDSIEE